MKTLRAWSDKPLQITIPSLNYKLVFILQDFRLEFKEHICYYKGFPSYSELSNFESKSKKTVANRLRAYNGSPMHFIRSLYANALSDEGFSVKGFTKHDNPAWPGDSVVAKMHEDARRLKNFSLLSPIPNRQFVTFEKHEWFERDLITSTEGRKYLLIPDYIQVIYSREPRESKYPDNSNSRFQVSQLQSGAKPVEIFADGSFSNADGLVYYGYMGWEKLADTLPFDYVP